MGAVFEVHHEVLNQRAALKVLCSEEDDRDVLHRFMHEAKAMANIAHENVARVLDVASLETGVPYILLELLEGQSLAKRMSKRELPLPYVA